MSNLNYYAANNITFMAAQALLNVGIETAIKQNISVSIAVVDRAGQLVAFGKMDAAPPISASVAEGKARTAAAIQDSTELFESMINRGEVAMLSVPHLVPLKGGLPLCADSEIIGAVGVSGSTSEGDLSLAKCIVAAL
ncbi:MULTISPECIES: GlcG/HbpS family heme-binding protein [Sodalis]|uniref:Glc operon protein GlcG n=1 Tax=Sodalis ligni TaxID=2697027 RepID=A0A4R1NBZ7_9GAMM|nr:heme-binding protein [Sodalis ligni]TCL02066.1 glc operon protein GlcG [Sodalis ligni]